MMALTLGSQISNFYLSKNLGKSFLFHVGDDKYKNKKEIVNSNLFEKKQKL